MTNPIGELAFLLWLAATVAALVLLILRLLRGGPGRRAAILSAAIAVSYPVAWMVTGSLAQDRDLPLGSTQCFDDWCVRVNGIREAGPNPVDLTGHRYYVLSLSVSNDATRSEFAPDHPQVRMVGRSGTMYPPSAEGQQALELVAGPQPPLNSRLSPLEHMDLQLAFEPDPRDRPWKALITEGTGPPIIGEQNAAWRAQTYVLIEN